MIACVQMKLNPEDYRTEQSFAAKILGIMERIRGEAGEGPLLVAFPEHIGTFCILANAPDRIWSKRTFAEAARALLLHHGAAVLHQLVVHRVSPVRALFLARSQEVERIYLSPFIQAARQYEAWIVAGSAALRWGQTSRVYNTAPVITPTGQVIYRQHKVNLVEMEQKQGLDLESAPLNYVSAVRSPFGALGVAVCLDAFHGEVRGRLQGLGAKILIQPSANPRAWDNWQQEDWRRSAYAAVAENKEFELAINPMLVGKLWDVEFAGQSSIIDQNGYVAQAQSSSEEEILLRTDLLN